MYYEYKYYTIFCFKHCLNVACLIDAVCSAIYRIIFRNLLRECKRFERDFLEVNNSKHNMQEFPEKIFAYNCSPSVNLKFDLKIKLEIA